MHFLNATFFNLKRGMSERISARYKSSLKTDLLLIDADDVEIKFC
jgi:hypothetical protein